MNGPMIGRTMARAGQQAFSQVPRLQQPPPGGPMSFAPPGGQPMRGQTTQLPTGGGMALASSNGGRQYTPNPFSQGFTPPQGGGNMAPTGAQRPPQLVNQQQFIAALRGRR